jgi:hypothetical protein
MSVRLQLYGTDEFETRELGDILRDDRVASEVAATLRKAEDLVLRAFA